MSTTLSFGPVSVAWPWSYTSAAFPNPTTSNGPFNYSTTQLTNGTGAAQADLLFTEQATITASGTLTIDLATATNAFGTSISFARLKAFYWENTTLGLSTCIAIGNAGVNPFTG